MLNDSWVLRMRGCSCPRSQGSSRGEVGLEPSPAPRLGRLPTGLFQSSLPAAPPDSPSVTSWLSPMEPPAHPRSPLSACAMLPSLLEAELQGQRPRPAAFSSVVSGVPTNRDHGQPASFRPSAVRRKDCLRAQKTAVCVVDVGHCVDPPSCRPQPRSTLRLPISQALTLSHGQRFSGRCLLPRPLLYFYYQIILSLQSRSDFWPLPPFVTSTL